MKSNIKYCGALQKYTISSDYPSNEIYVQIEDVEAIPIQWIIKWECGFLNPNGEHRRVIKEMLHDWVKENER